MILAFAVVSTVILILGLLDRVREASIEALAKRRNQAADVLGALILHGATRGFSILTIWLLYARLP